MENKITITLEEYQELKMMETKVSVIKSVLRSNKYVSVGELKTILDIKETEKENKNETV
jgi:phage pi2 protein 07